MVRISLTFTVMEKVGFAYFECFRPILFPHAYDFIKQFTPRRKISPAYTQLSLIGVRAQSTLGGNDKIPEFYMIRARKISEIPKFL